MEKYFFLTYIINITAKVRATLPSTRSVATTVPITTLSFMEPALSKREQETDMLPYHNTEHALDALTTNSLWLQANYNRSQKYHQDGS